MNPIAWLDYEILDIALFNWGLTVGGIAIALAAQNILGDLFASLSIVLDQPFAVGDFLIIGDFPDSVEKAGIKTTRLRSLSGEQAVNLKIFEEFEKHGIEFAYPTQTLNVSNTK